MKHLLIIGARGYGRGVYDIAKSMIGYGREFDIKGYLDDKSDALDNYKNYPPIIDSVENYSVQKDDVFVCALGDVRFKQKYVDIIRQKSGEFFTVIHPSATIGNNVRIGKGCIIGYNAQIDCDVTIGDYVNIQTNAVVGHDSVVGDWCMIDCFAFTGGFVKLGEGVTLHTRATVIPKLIVGDYATLNVGTVVIRKVESKTVLFGNPARQLIIPKVE